MRHRHTAVTLIAGAALLAAGCSQSGATNAETAAAPTVTATQHQLTAQDDAFLSQVDPFWLAGDRGTLIRTATVMCDQLRSGGTKDDLYRAVRGKGHDHEGDDLVNTAIKNYCPQYQ
ncbi:DUF732 domain-containing protein [Rhodococcus sp. D2-41]|uniref:DUF732 domain-containing protein n=1 Tax=Speluncibacter jeojiensis TaxID=2710754 RepID=A0A9X4M3S6_9ACTN|nr:DUF732 domain-containing protein [Rhodococcus sp. D2-41]MDG3010018.1 DUF732 domain-containing protein [Rhodococcus sp. D2-41]MDG3016277.1 DUF732 domain-containing protein [Corynebacteriales bacterium D3-21]